MGKKRKRNHIIPSPRPLCCDASLTRFAKDFSVTGLSLGASPWVKLPPKDGDLLWDWYN